MRFTVATPKKENEGAFFFLLLLLLVPKANQRAHWRSEMQTRIYSQGLSFLEPRVDLVPVWLRGRLDTLRFSVCALMGADEPGQRGQDVQTSPSLQTPSADSDGGCGCTSCGFRPFVRSFID